MPLEKLPSKNIPERPGARPKHVEPDSLEESVSRLEKDDFEPLNEGRERLLAETVPELLDHPLMQIDRRLQGLHYKLGEHTTKENIALCRKTCAKWEKELNDKWGYAVPSYVRQSMESHRKAEGEATDELRKMVCAEWANAAKSNPVLGQKIRVAGEELHYVSINADGTKRTWMVQPFGKSAALTFRSNDPATPDLTFSLDVMDGLDYLEAHPEMIDEAARRAVDDYSKENSSEQVRTLKRYDLPSDRPIMHLRVFPPEYDRVVSSGLETSMFLSSALKKRYGQGFQTVPPIFTDDPMQTLRKEMQAIVNAKLGKPVHFVIDVFSHGDKHTFSSFGKRFGPEDIVALAQEFPTASFTFNTMACFGAGMGNIDSISAFRDDARLQSRLAVFTQTKEHAVNVNTFSSVATPYYLHFINALYQGKSYGEAARIADKEVKAYMPIDAEAIISGQKMVMDEPAHDSDVRTNQLS